MIGDVDRGHKRASSFIRSGIRYWIQILQILYKGGALTVQSTISAPLALILDYLENDESDALTLGCREIDESDAVTLIL